MKKQFIKAVLVMIVFIVLAVIHLFITTQNIGLKYRLTEVKVKLNEVKSQNRSLGSAVSARENLAEIEKIAKTKLGMTYPEKINYVVSPKSR